MDINRTLYEETKIFSNPFGGYSFDEEELYNFLFSRISTADRQIFTLDIIEKILKTHGKSILLQNLAELARVEQGIQQLETWVRDHVVHSLLCYFLGIYLNERFLNPSIHVNEFQWKLAGLLHDLGYPVQIGEDILTPYSDKINEITSCIGIMRPPVEFVILPQNLTTLQNEVSSFTLLQNEINDWGLSIDVQSEYSRMISTGKICHGIISSLSVLYIIDSLYERYNPNRACIDIYDDIDHANWNQHFFETDVISACAAIYIHNLPSSCFRQKLNRNKAPLAFLLKLADCLQDWERPSLDEPYGIPSTSYDIEIIDNVLCVTMDVDHDRKQRIFEEIQLYLEADDIHIR